MFLRLALCIGIAAAVTVAWPAPVPGAAIADAAASARDKPDAATPAPAAPATPATCPRRTRDHGNRRAWRSVRRGTTLTGEAHRLSEGHRHLGRRLRDDHQGLQERFKAFVDKEGLKVDGQPMTIYTATDDTGFQFQAAIPVAEPPKTPPRGEIAVGTSPEGQALKFVHRGSYDGLDNTYEAITNYLDEKRLEAKDMFIEQYVTDPLTTNEDNLVVNVFVMIK